MPTIGLTRACTIGSILDALDKAGGSVPRVFRQADLSPRIVDNPNSLIFLKDQFALLDAASRENGDAGLAARLSVEAGINGLGDYGFLIVSQPTLREALLTAQAMLPVMLQTGSKVALTVEGRWAHWSYEVEDGAVRGRHENELLCTGYVLYVFRRFAGPNWVPYRHTIPSRRIDARAAIEALFGCTLSHGETTRLTFPADLLDCPNTAPLVPKPFEPMPTACDLPALVTYAIGAGLGEERPDLIRIARRLGLAPRTLQRRLQAHGTTFEHVLDGALSEQARRLMASPTPCRSQRSPTSSDSRRRRISRARSNAGRAHRRQVGVKRLTRKDKRRDLQPSILSAVTKARDRCQRFRLTRHTSPGGRSRVLTTSGITSAMSMSGTVRPT